MSCMRLIRDFQILHEFSRNSKKIDWLEIFYHYFQEFQELSGNSNLFSDIPGNLQILEGNRLTGTWLPPFPGIPHFHGGANVASKDYTRGRILLTTSFTCCHISVSATSYAPPPYSTAWYFEILEYLVRLFQNNFSAFAEGLQYCNYAQKNIAPAAQYDFFGNIRKSGKKNILRHS